MALNRKKTKGRKEKGTFMLIPHNVMDSEDFKNLSGSGLKVLLWLMRQYNGRNNGDMSATLSQVKECGVGSSASLTKALSELQESNLIVRTRDVVATERAVLGLAEDISNKACSRFYQNNLKSREVFEIEVEMILWLVCEIRYRYCRGVVLSSAVNDALRARFRIMHDGYIRNNNKSIVGRRASS